MPIQKQTQNITTWDALTLSQNIKSKHVSCFEVMEAYLAHIKRTNHKFNALVALQDEEKLLTQARQKDNELARGNYYGWMHGFPHAVKDLAQTKGIKTTMGSPNLEKFVPDHDQLIVERIKAAGAIIIGKTNVPEFGLGCQTYNNVYGTTANAFDNSKTSGGSSGGAAVGLATKMLPVADGSDMAGSLRNPAAFNNVVGFRPTQGSIPYWPSTEPNASSLATDGPMGRNVQDTAMLMSTIAGHDPRVPDSPIIDTSSFTQSLAKDISNLKLGWLGNFDNFLPLEKGVLDICEKALTLFGAEGIEIESTTPHTPPQLAWEAWLDLRSNQVGSLLKPFYDDLQKRKLVKPEAIWEIENHLKLAPENLELAHKKKMQWTNSIHRLFETYDFLVLPGSQVFPFDKKLHWVKEINGVKMENYHHWMAIYCLITITGFPILSLPIGFNENGLPMGIQIIGKHGHDLEVLKVSFELEKLLIS